MWTSKLPELTIHNSILAELLKYHLSRIQSVLNITARIVYGQARFEHITPTLWDRLHVSETSYVYLCDSTTNNAYARRQGTTWVSTALHSPTIVSMSPQDGVSGHHHIPCPAKTVMFGERSFAVNGPTLWNHLLDIIPASTWLCDSTLDFGQDHAMAL